MLTPNIRFLIGTLLSVLLLTACSRREQGTEPSASEPAAVAQEAPAPEPLKGMAKSMDGVSIAYSYWNRPAAAGRPALVFVHGWECDRGYWSAQVEAFADDYPIVTLDLAGHGDSGTERASWDLDTFGEDVRAVVEALGLERVVLIGHSMGGPAILSAETRLAERTLALIGVDTFHNAEFKADPDQWSELLEAYRSDFRGTCEKFVTSMFVDPESDLRSRVMEDMCSGPEDIGVALMAQFGVFDGAAAMGVVRAPIRSINAGSFPTEVEINRKYAPSFDAVVMEGVGHFLMMEKPEEFNRHLAAMIEGLLEGMPG